MSVAQTNRFWRVMTYRIYLFPSLRLSRIPLRQLIEQSGPSRRSRTVVTDVVRRTRLWKSEKKEVAVELIAHFKDGLESGRSTEELISTFGEIKTTARLMRRAKKRNRPLWWRAQRRLLQVFSGLLVGYVVVALLLTMLHPKVRVDYVAELNRPIMASAESDRAWPIYREAWSKAGEWPLNMDVLYLRDADDWPSRLLRPGDVQWPKAEAFLRQQKSLLDSIRAGGQKPALGYPMAFEVARRKTGRRFVGRWRNTPSTALAKEALPPTLQSILLPFLAPMRQSARVSWNRTCAGRQRGRFRPAFYRLPGIARHGAPNVARCLFW